MNVFLVQVVINEKKISFSGDMNLAQPIIDLKANGKDITTQIVSKKAGEITVVYKGTNFKVLD